TRRRDVMSIRQLLQSKRSQILQIAVRHGARKVRVFGSVARGTARRGSDIDFLVDMEEGRSLLDHAALIIDLERLLKRSVDVVSERGLRRLVRKDVLKDAVVL
ncbi:MAG: nucleotidyltransferase domain-containing protein, partial [Nitrospirota bacterium]